MAYGRKGKYNRRNNQGRGPGGPGIGPSRGASRCNAIEDPVERQKCKDAELGIANRGRGNVGRGRTNVPVTGPYRRKRSPWGGPGGEV